MSAHMPKRSDACQLIPIHKCRHTTTNFHIPFTIIHPFAWQDIYISDRWGDTVMYLSISQRPVPSGTPSRWWYIFGKVSCCERLDRIGVMCKGADVLLLGWVRAYEIVRGDHRNICEAYLWIGGYAFNALYKTTREWRGNKAIHLFMVLSP